MSKSPHTSNRSGPLVIAVLAALLLILHQDYWLWNDPTLVLGIFPIGLFWHICISIAATLLWCLATFIAWPFSSEPDFGNEPEFSSERDFSRQATADGRETGSLDQKGRA
jgi:hypothetical protein